MALATAASIALSAAAAASCRNGHGRIGGDSFVKVVRETSEVMSDRRLVSSRSVWIAFHVDYKVEYGIGGVGR